MQVKGIVRPDDPLLSVSLVQLLTLAGAVIAACYVLMGDLKTELKADNQERNLDMRELKKDVQEVKQDLRELKKDVQDLKAIVQSTVKGG